MEIPIYIGRGRALPGRTYTNRTKRWLRLRPEEANHILFLGGSGFGKTTVMRAIAEAIWIEYYRKEKIFPIIIIFERKFDTSKARMIREIYRIESQKYSEKKLYKKYGEETWKYIEKYVKLMENNPILYGSPGDFAMGMPNIIGKYTKVNEENSILGYFGLEPKAFPVNRFVFRPRRSLESIQVDNGWMTNVIEAKINYRDIDFSFIESLTNTGTGSLHRERLKLIWDIEKIRDPDKVLEKARELELKRVWHDNNIENPEELNKVKPTYLSRTYLRIEETMNRLKKDPLFSEEESFFKYVTNKRINIMDFSPNSDLTTEEENLIFKTVVNTAINTAFRYKIPVFIIVDEIQHFASNPIGLSAIDRIYREGRSMGITLIGATQYVAGLKKTLIIGCSHIGIVGKIASPEDLKIVKRMIPGIDDYDIGIDGMPSVDEYFEMKRINKFKGYFVYDKQYIERIRYRHPQSL